VSGRRRSASSRRRRRRPRRLRSQARWHSPTSCCGSAPSCSASGRRRRRRCRCRRRCSHRRAWYRGRPGPCGPTASSRRGNCARSSRCRSCPRCGAAPPSAAPGSSPTAAPAPLARTRRRRRARRSLTSTGISAPRAASAGPQPSGSGEGDGGGWSAGSSVGWSASSSGSVPVDAVRGRRAAAALARERVDAVGRRGRVVVAVVAAARIAAGDAVGEGAAVSRHALPAARGVRGAGGKGDHDERQERAALHSFSSIPRSAVPHAPAARVGHRVSVAGS